MPQVRDNRPQLFPFRCLVLLLVSLCSLTLRAAEPLPLSVEVEPDSWLSRTTGPYPLHLKLTWPGPRLLVGQLRVEVREGKELRCTLLTDELALNAGATRSTWLLPTVGQFNGSEQLQLDMKWIQEGRAVWSAVHPLRVPGEARRTVVLGVCASPSVFVQTLEQLLALERLVPVENAGRRQPLMTLTPQLPPSELPSEPLQLCIYDMLMLDEVSVRTLLPPQRSALLGWVRAGGAVFITGGNARWRREELVFVRELFREHPSGVGQIDATGALTSMAENDGPLLMTHCGLGCAALLLDSGKALEDPAIFDEAGRFLWRTRSPTEAFFEPQYLTPLHFAQVPEMRGLVDDLLPRGVEAVPFWLIVVVLLVYVILVGPFDYLTLGALQSRKWTWVTFPLLTLGVALGTVWITRAYLRSHGPPRSIVIRDVVENGEVVRETRLSVLFEVAAMDSVTEVPRGLCYSYGPNLVPRAAAHEALGIDPMRATMMHQPLLEGRMPHATRLRQELPERVPLTHRLLTIPLAADKQNLPASFDWNKLPMLESAELGGLADELRREFGAQASAWVFQGENRFSVLGQSLLFPSRQPDQSVVPGYDTAGLTFADLIAGTTLRTQGFFRYVSQVSPACDPALEDLALLDPGDPSQAVLVIAVPDDAGWTVYRRRFRRADDGSWK